MMKKMRIKLFVASFTLMVCVAGFGFNSKSLDNEMDLPNNAKDIILVSVARVDPNSTT